MVEICQGKSKNSVLSALEQDILTVLAGRAAGVYGLKILAEINEARQANKLRGLSIGSLYPTLGRMQQAGLIEEKKREPVESPRRKYYAISEDGQCSLARVRAYRDLLSSDAS